MAAITRDLKDALRKKGLNTFRCNDENAQHSIISGLRAALKRATQEGYAHELITSRRDQDCLSAELDGEALRDAFIKQPISHSDLTAEGQAFHTLMKHMYDLNEYGECLLAWRAVGNARPRLISKKWFGNQERRTHR